MTRAARFAASEKKKDNGETKHGQRAHLPSERNYSRPRREEGLLTRGYRPRIEQIIHDIIFYNQREEIIK